MGNWRTVEIVGSIDPTDADAAQTFINTGNDWKRFHCLCFYGPSMCGLGPWIPEAGGEIDVVGNLSERDYDVEDVAATLRELVVVAPSLRVSVHCGDDWESHVCIATITVADGAVTVGAPTKALVGEQLSELGAARLRAILGIGG